MSNKELLEDLRYGCMERGGEIADIIEELESQLADMKEELQVVHEAGFASTKELLDAYKHRGKQIFTIGQYARLLCDGQLSPGRFMEVIRKREEEHCLTSL
jgi:hypothetical protein